MDNFSVKKAAWLWMPLLLWSLLSWSSFDYIIAEQSIGKVSFYMIMMCLFLVNLFFVFRISKYYERHFFATGTAMGCFIIGQFKFLFFVIMSLNFYFFGYHP